MTLSEVACKTVRFRCSCAHDADIIQNLVAIVHAADLFANGGPLLARRFQSDGFRPGTDSPFDWDFIETAGLTSNLSTWQQAHNAGTPEFVNA